MVKIYYQCFLCPYVLDLSRTECTASQETCDSELDFDVVYTPFVAGSLVWAKVPGYPWYVAIIYIEGEQNTRFLMSELFECNL